MLNTGLNQPLILLQGPLPMPRISGRTGEIPEHRLRTEDIVLSLTANP